MKKLILVMTMAVLIFQTAKAQDSNFTFGLKVGTNLSNIYDSQSDKLTSTSKFGFVGGAFVGISLGKYLGIQPEVHFSQKGFVADGSILGTTYSLTRTTNFIDIPLLLTIKPIPMLTIVVGPQYSYLLSQKDDFSNAVFNTEQNQQFSNDNIRKNILGGVLGVDLNFDKIVVGLRIGRDFQNNNGDGTSSTPRYKNAWAQATLGFKVF